MMTIHPYLYADEMLITTSESIYIPKNAFAPWRCWHPKILQFAICLLATLWAEIAVAASPWLDFSLPQPPPTPASVGDQTDQPKSAAELFATVQSPGSIAVGVAEGNMDITGEATPLYQGHTDPGNGVTNRGFCSWNRAAKLTVAEADASCLSRLQVQAADTEKQLQSQGLDPQKDVIALVNGTDLANQSPRAGEDFGTRYAEALAKGLKGEKALIDARVESFREPSVSGKGTLSASGLFRICRHYASYRDKLAAHQLYSEAWRWQCIALDQGRRVRAIDSALAQNLASPPPRRHISPSPDRNSALDFGVSQTPRVWEDTPTPPPVPAPDLGLDFRVSQTPATTAAVSTLDFGVEEPTPPEPSAKPPFSGNPVTKTGTKIGNCTITDIRRFRSKHPVSGMPPRWHNGIDIACGGTHNVYSPVDGNLTILPPAKSGGGGLVARITTKSGWTVQNMHMLEITAKAGKVAAGEKLGTGGAPNGHPNAGTSTGPHSHYERFRVVEGQRQYVTPTDTELKALLGGG
ncbi:MAG TPA: M23 family metallopeptidase [Oscillatoriaceae cyanobacterium M33_DOE_052]|uniref:M23 family metallopeptidase n=1 Tax=Planktothricoides sp. SpSt-374 TaxID=2282167 RepID=A0A7C3VUV0_9CYAN|nr:M23 family metallopeptidase [Oscillatoriaceae cyanobacterium M33_DOE_052]